jgi:hypothetical protein
MTLRSRTEGSLLAAGPPLPTAAAAAAAPPPERITAYRGMIIGMGGRWGKGGRDTKRTVAKPRECFP